VAISGPAKTGQRRKQIFVHRRSHSGPLGRASCNRILRLGFNLENSLPPLDQSQFTVRQKQQYFSSKALGGLGAEALLIIY
jgi:hypothetical protein